MKIPYVDPLNANPAWWATSPEKPEQVAQRLFRVLEEIECNQVSITEGHRRHAKLYSGYLPHGLSQGNSKLIVRDKFEATKAVVRLACDTAHALIVRSRPKSSIVTDGGDWDVQLQAEELDQFLVGAYHVGGLYPVAGRVFHDSTWAGTGLWKYVPRGSGAKFRVDYERVLPLDFIVDETECRDGLEPENTYHRMIVRIDALIAKYASRDDQMDLRQRIRGSARAGAGAGSAITVPEGSTVVIEAIHVGDDGFARRVLACHGVILRDEPWPYDFHPYTWLWWAPPISGFYGDGIAYRQAGRQTRITYLYRWIQRCHDQFATPRIWADPAGGPPTLQISNEIGAIVQTRRPVQFEPVKQVVPPEVYRWLNELEEGTLEDEGMTRGMSNSQPPPGVVSAPAQRELSFKETQRFAPVSQRWEHSIAVECARKTIAMYKRAAESGERPKVAWANQNLLFQIEFPDLDEKAYEIRPEASSLESLSPAARKQTALEYAQTGWLTPEQGRRLVDLPDLREDNQLADAPIDYAKYVLKQLYKGEVIHVDQKCDLAILELTVLRGRLRAIVRKAPQKIIKNLDRFLDELQSAQDEMAQAAAPPMGGGGAAPMGPAGLTPGLSPAAGTGAVPFDGKAR